MKNLFISIVCVLLMAFPTVGSTEMVVNESVIETQISRDEAVKIFLFYRKFWDKSGTRIVVVLPPPNSVLFRRLASEELNLGPTEYYENVKAKMFAGAAQPVIAESENEVLIKISNIPYSIGYYHGNFKINTGFGIRTITVQ